MDRGDKIFGILGTVLFHLLILLILAVTVLRANSPDETPIVEVEFIGGGSPASQGGGNMTPQPEATPPPSEPVQASPQPLNPQPPVITQEDEESVRIAEANRKKAAEEKLRIEAEERRRRAEEAERARKAEQERRDASAISNQVAGSFGKGGGNGSGQGNASGSGQGDNPFGNGRGGSGAGTGAGYGSFNLDGRSLQGELPRPAYTVQEEGKIVIDITVNPQGTVILAEIGRGTNITNDSMRRSAVEAARKAQFNSIGGANNQRGTITYNYTLR